MPKCYIIDGNSLLFRAFYATYRGDDTLVMRNKDGVPTNALFAFSNMINRILASLKPNDSIFVAFDTGKATFRHEEDKDYKANRKPCPPLLKEQMPIVREFLKSLNIYTYEKEGFEADDIAGTFSKLAKKDGYDVIIYTSDRDYLQLIEDNITIHILKTGMSNIVVMNEEEMMKEYGISPLQIIDYKGLRGDSSDNLPGIPGVGDKTAIKLIQEYGSFDKIVEAAKTMDSKVGKSIVENEEVGRMCYRLATIDTHVELPFEVKDTVYSGYDFTKINDFCANYDLRTFINKLPNKLKIVDLGNEDFEYKKVSNIGEPIDLDHISISLDIEPGNYHTSILYGLGLHINGENLYIDIDDAKKDKKLLEILKNNDIKKYCFDYKAIKVALSYQGIEINGLEFDILLGAYLLDSSLNNSVEGVMNYFGVNIATSQEAISLFDNSNPEKTAKIAFYIEKIKNKVISELDKQECLKLYNEIEIPLADVLADMEIEGMPLDAKTLEDLGETFKANLEAAKARIYELAGEEFNIDSPKQLGEILFNKLGLTSNKKGSTSADVLKDLVMAHPIVPEILIYRKYAKLVSTYVTSLLGHIHEDGKIHAMFNQALTTTGRLSSSDPNLQNISVRDEEGKLVRKAFFYPNNEYEILSLDYSQVELRVLASLSNCQKLKDIFASGHDIHAETAAHIFNVEKPTDAQRRAAKATNFGIIYGISDWGLSEQIDVPVKEAKQIINAFYEAYPEVGQYFQKVTEDANKNGYVTTLFGRRRYLREIHDANFQKREFARRAAMNAPIQGTAADLIKIAMIKVTRALKEKNLKSKVVLQIHDELLLKVPEEEKDITLPLVKDIMENALDIGIDFKVDGGYGRTWYDAK